MNSYIKRKNGFISLNILKFKARSFLFRSWLRLGLTYAKNKMWKEKKFHTFVKLYQKERTAKSRGKHTVLPSPSSKAMRQCYLRSDMSLEEIFQNFDKTSHAQQAEMTCIKTHQIHDTTALANPPNWRRSRRRCTYGF
jgi:hypothetical protein